jgi:hypothetical protein
MSYTTVFHVSAKTNFLRVFFVHNSMISDVDRASLNNTQAAVDLIKSWHGEEVPLWSGGTLMEFLSGPANDLMLTHPSTNGYIIMSNE